jgi:hypothetical protein
MSISLFGLTIVRTAELDSLRERAAASVIAPPGPAPDGTGVPPPVVREVIRVADGLLDLTGHGSSADPQQVGPVLRWIEARTRSLLAACDVVRVEETGGFDARRHEALASRAAPSPQFVHQIADTVRPGYLWHGVLLRPQQVIVYVPADQAAGTDPR